MKVVVTAFKQEKALVGSFSVMTNLRMDLFEAHINIPSATVTREELLVTSKLWNTDHSAEHVEAACRRSLADLQLEYLDLYLIHFPIRCTQ